jgi:signal peptidase II
MNEPRLRTFIPSLLIALVAIVSTVLDQLSKWWIISNLYFDPTCSLSCAHKILIPDWLEFAPVANTHGAFGMLGSSKLLLLALACIVLLVFSWSFRAAAARSRLVCVAFGMIAGGALGNIIDRLHYGYVIDFVDFYRFPQIWRFTFNVGDVCITFGVILLLISNFFRARRKASDAGTRAAVGSADREGTTA